MRGFINQTYAEYFSSLFHVKPRNLPRYHIQGPRWSGPLIKYLGKTHANYLLKILWISELYWKQASCVEKSRHFFVTLMNKLWNSFLDDSLLSMIFCYAGGVKSLMSSNMCLPSDNVLNFPAPETEVGGSSRIRQFKLCLIEINISWVIYLFHDNMASFGSVFFNFSFKNHWIWLPSFHDFFGIFRIPETDLSTGS